ncbi:unnamed protein product [Closterium sp. NIES-54]
MPRRSDFTYTSCYCEENVYLLCRSLVSRGVAHVDDLAVVFISNPDRKVPMWCQKAGMCRADDNSGSEGGGGGEEQGLVVWDYHVIAIHVKHINGARGGDRGGSEGSRCRKWYVWDLDTVLAFPSLATEYVRRALWAGRSSLLPLQDTYQRFYRVVSASNYFSFFASDRSHMRDTITNMWLASPPKYPCIHSQDGESNRLESYIRMSPADTVDIQVVCKDYSECKGISSSDRVNWVAWKLLLCAHNFGVVLDELSLCLLLGASAC